MKNKSKNKIKMRKKIKKPSLLSVALTGWACPLFYCYGWIVGEFLE